MKRKGMRASFTEKEKGKLAQDLTSRPATSHRASHNRTQTMQLLATPLMQDSPVTTVSLLKHALSEST
jgi:hypothetical protein